MKNDTRIYITVFTPTYNRGYCIKRVFDSLCCQTYSYFEWIIVDDGSTDNTCDIVESFKKEANFNIRYYKQKNSGKHIAINFAAHHATYPWFFIVDSDDYLKPDALYWLAFYAKQIEQSVNFAGVVGLRCDSKDNIWIKKDKINKRYQDFLNREYIDANSETYRLRYKIIGDRAEMIKTEILLKYPFPSFENEKFMPESVLWDRLSQDGYMFRWFNKKIYVTEYLNDGLTKNLKALYKKSPNSISLYFNISLKNRYLNILNKIKFLTNYYIYGIVGGNSVYHLYKSANNKILTIPAILICGVLYRRKNK